MCLHFLFSFLCLRNNLFPIFAKKTRIVFSQISQRPFFLDSGIQDGNIFTHLNMAGMFNMVDMFNTFLMFYRGPRGGGSVSLCLPPNL